MAGPALVFDASSGSVFYAEDADRSWHPASLTKLMTAYVTFKAIRDGQLTMKSKVVCSKTARAQAPSKLGLPLGTTMSLPLALKALIVKSANDVAVMLAEKVAGSEQAFVLQMNAAAQNLGMTRTRFFNPHGLPHAGQVTTARDMGLLAKAIIRDFPEHAHLFRMSSVRIGKKKLKSHNSLLRSLPGADGMKTGFICASGFNIVASATRGNQRLVAVVLGGSTARERNARARELIEHSFETYFWKSLFSQNNITSMPIDPTAPVKPTNFRRHVRVWACGYRPKKKQNVKKKRKRKSKRVQLIIHPQR